MTPEQVEALRRMWTHADPDVQAQGEHVATTLGFEAPLAWDVERADNEYAAKLAELEAMGRGGINASVLTAALAKTRQQMIDQFMSNVFLGRMLAKDSSAQPNSEPSLSTFARIPAPSPRLGYGITTEPQAAEQESTVGRDITVAYVIKPYTVGVTGVALWKADE